MCLLACMRMRTTLQSMWDPRAGLAGMRTYLGVDWQLANGGAAALLALPHIPQAHTTVEVTCRPTAEPQQPGEGVYVCWVAGAGLKLPLLACGYRCPY